MLPSALKHFMSGPTRAFYEEAAKIPDYSFMDWIHGYVYARWPYFYIGMGTGTHPLAKRFSRLPSLLSGVIPHDDGRPSFADGYHGKVSPPAQARQLIHVDKPLELRDLEQVIPYAAARDIVLKNPDHIAALQCPCRTVREDPCAPLDVCIIVGEPFVGFITHHHPTRARRLERAEAEDILQAEHERGHVHHAFFKDAMLQRFYAICNCCSCCCGAMQAQRNGVPMLASSGYLAAVDDATCKGCGLCAKKCPFDAIRMAGGDDDCAVVDPARCLGCGVCADTCASGAMTLQRSPAHGAPLDIQDLQDRA